MVGMDPESQQFGDLQRELAEQGKAERERIQAQVDRKSQKIAKKAPSSYQLSVGSN